MAIAFVQSASGVLNAGTVTFGSNITAGNTIIVLLRSGNSASPNTIVTDTQGNFYQQAAYVAARLAIFHAFNAVGGANTITVATNGAAPSQNVIAAEYSGITGVNTNQVINQNVSTAFTVGPVTPTSAAVSNLVIVGFTNETTTSCTLGTITGGFTERSPGSKASHFLDLIQASAAAATCGATVSASVSFTGAIVVYSSGIPSMPCFVQGTSTASANSGVATFGNKNQAGNLLVASCRFTGTLTTPAISDSAGNSWVLTGSRTVGTSKENMYHVLGCLASSSNTVTITGASVLQISVAEYANVNTLGTSTTGAASSTAYSVGPLTPPVVNSVMVSTIANETANTVTYTVSGGLLQRSSADGNACIFDTRLNTIAATTNAATMSPTVNWGGVAAIFYNASGGKNFLMMMGVGT